MARLLTQRVLTRFRIAMPPKRKISAKHDDAGGASDTEGASQSQPQAKRAKRTETVTSDDAKVAPNGQPTNKVLPVNIVFPPRTEGTLRFATWNVCGLAAAQRKVRISLITSDGHRRTRFQGFKHYVEAEDPDILVLTETKVKTSFWELLFHVLDASQVNNEPVDPAITARFPYCTWAISGKKTYGASIRITILYAYSVLSTPAGGTAVLSKIKPISVTKLLPGHPDPEQVKGRLVTVEFEGCYVVGTYVTNAGQELKVPHPACPSKSH